MERMTRDELQGLIEPRKGPCVSIYMPTHRMGATRQDPILLKNLLREAEGRLVEGGLRAPEARDLLGHGRKMVRDSPFWSRRSDGLAVFFAPEMHRWHSLPLPIEPLVVVGDRFHVKPLLPSLSGDGRFYVLALSQNDVRLLQGTRHSVAEIDLPGTPRSIGEALKYDDPEKSLQFRTIVARPGGKRPSEFHGHGSGFDDAKEGLRRFFRQVDRGVREALKEERAPVVLAGVEYLLPVYREASDLPGLSAEGIAGNPDEISARELHRRAWEIVHPHFLRDQEEAAARYRELAGTGKASGDLKVVVPAAFGGRVETLFVAVGRQRWGTFDPESGAVRIRRRKEPRDEDLLDFAAIHTFLNGGTVYAVDPARVPGRSPVAAVFRY